MGGCMGGNSMLWLHCRTAQVFLDILTFFLCSWRKWRPSLMSMVVHKIGGHLDSCWVFGVWTVQISTAIHPKVFNNNSEPHGGAGGKISELIVLDWHTFECAGLWSDSHLWWHSFLDPSSHDRLFQHFSKSWRRWWVSCDFTGSLFVHPRHEKTS